MNKVLRTRFNEQGSTFKYKICSTKCKISTDKNAFQASECYNPTLSQARVLVVQASIAAYLTRFAVEIIFLRFAQHEKKKKFIPTSYVQGQPFPCPQPRIPIFWFTSSGFCKRPILFEVLAPASLFLWGSHMQREYCKRTTLHSKSSTSKGLLYAPDPNNHEKGMLSDQPRLSRVSSMALLCCWGRSHSKIWRSLWLTLRRMPYDRGTLRIPLQRIS